MSSIARILRRAGVRKNSLSRRTISPGTEWSDRPSECARETSTMVLKLPPTLDQGLREILGLYGLLEACPRPVAGRRILGGLAPRKPRALCHRNYPPLKVSLARKTGWLYVSAATFLLVLDGNCRI